MVWCSGWRLAAAVSNAGGRVFWRRFDAIPETLRSIQEMP